MFDINMGKFVADANVQAAMMLRPERLPDIPTPTKPPEPTWVEPMQIIPGMAAPAQQQSVAMPLIQGFGSAASNLASIDWSSGVGGGKQPQTYGTSGIPGITSGLSYSGPTSYAGVKF
jgi:hypothetical protein